EGGTDFAVVAVIEASVDEARALATKLGDALAARGIVYNLELTDDDDDARPMQIVGHSDLAVFKQRRAALREKGPRVSPSAPKLVLGERLRTGSQDVVHAGTYGDAPVLVTLTAKHAESLDTLRARLALPFDGIAPLVAV